MVSPSNVLEVNQIVVSCNVASLSADLHGVSVHVVLNKTAGNETWKYLLQNALSCSLNCYPRTPQRYESE